MAVHLSPASDYARTLQQSIRHAEIVFANGRVCDLPDGSQVTLSDLGIIVRTPDSFLPYSSVFEIREAAPAS